MSRLDDTDYSYIPLPTNQIALLKLAITLGRAIGKDVSKHVTELTRINQQNKLTE
jgi:hypothetical protein